METATEAAQGRAAGAMGQAMRRTADAMGEAVGRMAADTVGRTAGMAADTVGRTAGTMGPAARSGAMIGPNAGYAVVDAAMATGKAWLELMMGMQRASVASLSVYSPSHDTRIEAGSAASLRRAEDTVLPVGEERLNVGTLTVLGGTTRIRRRVVEQPVEHEVTLREERVVVERRPLPPAEATAAPRASVLTDTVVEMSDSHQVPQVWKSVHVAEEVVLRRQVTERREQVREVLRRDVVDVEHDAEGRDAIASGRGAARSGDDAPERGDEADVNRARADEAAARRSEALAEAARQATNAGAAQARQRAEEAAARDRPREGDQAEGNRRGAEQAADVTRRGAEASSEAVRRGAEAAEETGRRSAEASAELARRGAETADEARRAREEQERGRGHPPAGPGQPSGAPQRKG